MELHTGHHWIGQLWGMTFHLDTIFTTWIVSAIIIFAMWLATRRLTLVPTGMQNVIETVMEALSGPFKETLGEKWSNVSSVLFTFFFFILVSNELGLIPSNHVLASPTNDLNTALALALASSFVVTVTGIKIRGFKNYFSHFFKPYAPFVILNVIEEITKPLTLSFRLFGNILAGEIMLEILNFLVPTGFPIIWIAFSIGIGIIQAFVFTLLTTAYLGIIVSDEH